MNHTNVACSMCGSELVERGAYFVCTNSICSRFEINQGQGNNLGPDAPIVTNVDGGMQSLVAYRFDLLDPHAMLTLANILDYGAKRYTPNNWRKIPISDHINHALIHIFAHMSGDTQDDHLGHAFCRLMFALGVEHERNKVL